jgi:hypothetical protein
MIDSLIQASADFFNKKTNKNRKLLMDALKLLSFSHLPQMQSTQNDISYCEFYSDSVFVVTLFILGANAVIPVKII